MQETVKNLAKAFIGESMARNRYTFYASTAKKEGFEHIAEIFLQTADNEREHANWLLKFLHQLRDKGADISAINVESAVPTVRGTTLENINAAIAGETWEFTTMYPDFAAAAEKEGLKDIADRLRYIAEAEVHHAQRYQAIKETLEAGKVFEKDEEVWWVCRECGYMYKAKKANEKCPTCEHPLAFQQLLCDCI